MGLLNMYDYEDSDFTSFATCERQYRLDGRVASGEGGAKCKNCARVCPMQLTPYDSRGQEIGYLDPDCLKCGKCTLACPTKIMTLKH